MYDYGQLTALNDQVTGQQLQGQVGSDVVAQLLQQAAERGIMTGQGGGPNTNAAYLAALGLTSTGQQQAGQAAFAGTRSATLQAQQLAEQAAEFQANMTFKDKELAQTKGLTEEQYAMQMAQQAQQQKQFEESQAQSQLQFTTSAGQEQQRITAQGGQFQQQEQLAQQQAAQQASQFQQNYQLQQQELAQKGQLGMAGIAAGKVAPAPWWTATGVYGNPAMNTTVYKNAAGQVVGPNGF
jgi:hypothetical protein